MTLASSHEPEERLTRIRAESICQMAFCARDCRKVLSIGPYTGIEYTSNLQFRNAWKTGDSWHVRCRAHLMLANSTVGRPGKDRTSNPKALRQWASSPTYRDLWVLKISKMSPGLCPKVFGCFIYPGEPLASDTLIHVLFNFLRRCYQIPRFLKICAENVSTQSSGRGARLLNSEILAETYQRDILAGLWQ